MKASEIFTSVSEHLETIKKKASDVMTDFYDHIEQKNRDRTRPPTQEEKDWDAEMERRRKAK